MISVRLSSADSSSSPFGIPHFSVRTAFKTIESVISFMIPSAPGRFSAKIKIADGVLEYPEIQFAKRANTLP